MTTISEYSLSFIFTPPTGRKFIMSLKTDKNRPWLPLQENIPNSRVEDVHRLFPDFRATGVQTAWLSARRAFTKYEVEYLFSSL
jgi:hypothetical protein